MVLVSDKSGDLPASAVVQCQRHRVLVDHHLDGVGCPGPAGLRVDDDHVLIFLSDEVRLAGQGRQVSAQAEGVLVLGVDLVSALLPVVSDLVEDGGVVEEPLGLVEV